MGSLRRNRRGWHVLWGMLAVFVSVVANADDHELSEPGTAIPVELIEDDSGWRLLRGGEPYFIRGAGGNDRLDELAAIGGNSIRLWAADNAGEILDAAHAAGLTVTLGIWLGHERHGFDYQNAEQVAEQLERVRQTVLTYRDHPALLIWALGNEMEGFADGDNPAIWKAVNDAARVVKELDPHHPTMTVTAEIGGERVRFVHEVCDAIDIHGINSYGGAPSLAERLIAAGGTKPVVLTEFGPAGTWETATTEWGAPYEPTSTVKANQYESAYRKAILDNPGIALGGYVFLWGHKMEGTDTWFGMFLRDGSPVAAVDRMQQLWTGESPEILAPTISSIRLSENAVLEPGTEITAEVELDQPAQLSWVMYPESGDYLTGGDYRPAPVPVDDVIRSTTPTTATIRAPLEPGPYRLAAYAIADSGKAATANVPIRVAGEVGAVRFPVYVYEDGFDGMPWAPSGWMGNTDALSLDPLHAENPKFGDHSLQVRFEGLFGWAAVAWQHPAGDWGDLPGGFDLSGARALEVWARGEYGGERVKFGVGLIQSDKPNPDSAIEEIADIELTDGWTRYEIPLDGLDLSTIKTGFVFALEGRRTAVTFYLDRVRFVR